MFQVTQGHCFHCNESMPKKENFQIHLLGDDREFCCLGCLEVAKAIVDTGLQDYYTYRSEAGDKANALPEELNLQNNIYDVPELGEEYISEKHGSQNPDSTIGEVQLTIEGLNCPACAWLIEKRLNTFPAIKQVGVDISARRATIRWQSRKLKLSAILNAVQDIGYRARPFQPDEHEQVYNQENKTFLKKIGLAGLMTMQVMMLAFGLYFGVFGNLDEDTKSFFHWISLMLSTPVVFYSGSIFIVSALNGLSAKTLNMDLPVTIAILVTWFSSAWTTWKGQGEIYFESICMFIFLLLIGRYFEHRGRQKAIMTGNNATRQLPTFARLINNDGNLTDKPARSIKPDDIILIKTGDIVPVDCQLVEGKTEVDESILTGESDPVLKTDNATLYGGTINLIAPVKGKVTSALKDSTIHQISRAQELAFAQKPSFAIQADRLASYFVTIVLIISAMTWLYWSNTAPENALWITVSVLVATCPCALGLATPTAFSAAMNKLNSLGLILKRTDILESLNSVTVFAFDKTGTLTLGHPEIDSFINHDEHMSEQQILEIAAAIESHSEHPIARAFTNGSYTNAFFTNNSSQESSNVKSNSLQSNNPQVFPGDGISVEINNVSYLMGTASFCNFSSETNVNRTFFKEAISKKSMDIAGDVYLAKKNKKERQSTLLATFTLKDRTRPGLSVLFKQLSKEKILILSGDSEAKVTELATELGINNFRFGLKPADKQNHIAELQDKNEMVLMTGDGVNDAPVLARADISMAVNGASDFAKNAADIIMLKDDFSVLASLMLIAKKTKRIIKQNFAWALGYNLLVLPFAVSGVLPPWAAVIGMSLSSLAVTFNSMRLNRNDKLGISARMSQTKTLSSQHQA